VLLLIDFSFSNTLIPKGKTYWILYAVRRRLGEAKSFLWCFAQHWYLFVQDGVFKFPEHFDPTSFAPFIWTFIDANEFPSGLPSGLASVYSNLFVILASSPRQDQWKPLTKNSYSLALIMNPWTWEEMDKA
jgi:hypothetical protein